MICKYCGKESDNGSDICSVCRDMLGADEPETETAESFEVSIEDAPEEKKERKSRKEKAHKERSFSGEQGEKKDLIPIIALVMCVVCLVAAVSAVYSAAKMRSELGTAVEFANKTQSQKIADLENRVGELEQYVAEQQQAKQQAEEAALKNFKIKNAPGDETRELGYKSQPDHYLFGFIIDGKVQSFTWEKQLADGSYIPVVFDESGKCAEFGIVKLESVADGYSKLVADGLTIQAAGTYKCTAVNPAGEKLEASVVLNVTE